MKRFFNILIFALFFILSSICPAKPPPEKIQLNEWMTWDTRKDVIQIHREGYFENTTKSVRDSLSRDAGIKINRIKQNL
jgi:hypothetical protein